MAEIVNPQIIVQHFRDRVASLIAKESEVFCRTSRSEEWPYSISMLCKQVKGAINSAQLTNETLLKLLDCKGLESTKPWLAKGGFADLLAKAYIAKHSGAMHAIELLIQEPHKYAPKIIASVAIRLAEMSQTHEEVCELTIKLLAKSDTVGSLHRFLESNTGLSSKVLLKVQSELASLHQRLINSSSGIDRRQGAWLWTYLIRVEIDIPPPLDKILSLMSRESDQQTYAWLALLLGRSAARGRYDIKKVVEILWPLCMNKNENIREKAMTGIFEAILQPSIDPSPFIDRVLEAALSKPTDANRLSQIGILIERLISNDIELAVILVEKLFLAPEVAELGRQAKRWLITRLRKPIRSLFSSSSSELQKRLLNIIPTTDAFMGRILVDAACYNTFRETIPVLDILLDHPKAESKVKELIRRHKHQRERTVGGYAWPELYNNLIS